MQSDIPSLQGDAPAVTEPATQAKSSNPPAHTGSAIARLVIGAIVILAIVLFVRRGMHRGLSIETQPTGATVFINGRLVGKSPVRIEGLEGGSYSVRIEKEDFASLSKPVVLGWGITHLNETLPQRGVGILKIAIDPVGAEVLLDGELIGHSPLDLNNVAAGSHELQLRKTNFKAFTSRMNIEPGQTQEFKDFALEDLVLTMLQNGIDKEPQRVANYMDMGHYLFANNKIREAGDFYVRGLQVAAQPLTFEKDTPQEERNNDQQLRAHDIERINDELRKKLNNTGRNLHEKDMRLLSERITRQQEANASQNAGDWKWVYEQARNFIEGKKFDQGGIAVPAAY